MAKMMKRCWYMWIYRISRGGQRARPADLKSQGKVNLCGVESCAHNLRQLAIAVTPPLSIIGSDDQRMVSIKCRFEGAKRQSFQNDHSPLRANTRTSWKAGESDGPATL
jgi:hypothetical protein